MPSRRRTAPAAARSLADDVRGRTDEQLSALVLRRPDLARPTPSDLTALAARASTRASVQRCLEALDRGRVQVLEAAVAAGDGADPARVAGLLGAPVARVRPVLEHLWGLALLWRGGDGLHVVRTVTEVLGPTPAGLGPALADLPGGGSRPTPDADAVRRLVADAPPAATALLERMTWGPPLGVAPAGDVGGAVGWLIEHGVLVRLPRDLGDLTLLRGAPAAPGDTRVVLPREVALALRGDRTHERAELDPPPVATRDLGVEVVDGTAAAVVLDLLTAVGDLLLRWGAAPPRVLRTGGLAVRDLRATATALDLDPDRTAFVAEVALAAGLLADDGELEPVWAPTPLADAWEDRPAGERWAVLAQGWRDSTRAPHLVGSPTGSGGRAASSSGTTNALGPDVQWPAVRGLRAEVLGELATLDPGQAPDADDLLDRLRWRRPLRSPRVLQETATAVLREAEWLGVTGRGALSGAGRRLVAREERDVVAAAMATALPAPVDHVLLQADLTAVAPGPLEGALARLVRLVADVESRGGATVHRFSPDSVRRALDEGWSADELLDRLREASRTGVPQPLEYLVRDVARRHGQVRVGAATAYLRSDDEAALGAMLAERRLASLRLRRIAPTVLVSSADPRVLLETLRDNGFAPVQEGPEGRVVVVAPPRRRAKERRLSPRPVVTPLDPAAAADLVGRLRVAEEAAREARAAADPDRPRLEPTEPAVTVAALRDAAADRRGLWIGYADAAGRTEVHLFYPLRVEGGRAVGRVADGADERAFGIHRITGVAPL
ncbi:helicase-associated domain-containing protein [Lapillicoccus jejuensis]|uniref:XPB/Ssl2-like helicase family protein n=1 Tax=Lapillicoccus jejuensis TaxID=402171 RepID=A0A542E0V3_9MICO|nr:helicase-associated domain-containing protein [Lapillicoccus jejuensis]TQJ08955.1 XPB/Ssl2-like helicase family protein [Lapillicoccus jejuensis]